MLSISDYIDLSICVWQNIVRLWKSGYEYTSDSDEEYEEIDDDDNENEIDDNDDDALKQAYYCSKRGI